MNFRYSERIEHYSGELFWSCSLFVLDGCVQAISFFGIGGVIFHASYLLPGALLIWTLVERKKNSLFLEAGSGTCLQIFCEYVSCPMVSLATSFSVHFFALFI